MTSAGRVLEEIRKLRPEATPEQSFGSLALDSLSWASLLNRILAGVEKDKQSRAVELIFVEQDFETLSARALEDILHALD